MFTFYSFKISLHGVNSTVLYHQDIIPYMVYRYAFMYLVVIILFVKKNVYPKYLSGVTLILGPFPWYKVSFFQMNALFSLC